MPTATDGRRVAYALLGAPVWAAKRIAELTEDLGELTRREMDDWIKEGEQIAKRLGERNVVEELSERVDFDQIQDQVERLRDQLETVLTNWRENFRREGTAPQTPVRPAAAKKPAARQPAAKKPAAKTTAAKKPAARKPAAKKPAAKTTAAKKPAARKPAAAKATGK